MDIFNKTIFESYYSASTDSYKNKKKNEYIDESLDILISILKTTKILPKCSNEVRVEFNRLAINANIFAIEKKADISISYDENIRQADIVICVPDLNMKEIQLVSFSGMCNYSTALNVMSDNNGFLLIFSFDFNRD